MTELARLQAVFQNVFSDSELRLPADASTATFQGWDSFMHINLVVAVEEEYSVKFTVQEISQITSVPAILSALKQKDAK